MLAEIISIGDEMTSGQRLDTNSQWLSEQLGLLGVKVMYHTTVADDLAANIQVFRAAAERTDLIIASGGLGPTADDLTREALAATIGVPLVQSPEALAHIQALFARRSRPMPERNVVQSLFPAGSRVIHNPHGTAPGIDLAVPRLNSPGSARIFSLPGVPAEMKEMWQGTVAPTILAMQPEAKRIRHHTIHCFGVGESDLEAMLPDLIRRGRVPQVGITVSQATITLRIAAEGTSDDEIEGLIAPTSKLIYESLGDLVYGEQEQQLHDAVAALLARRSATLATLEIATLGQAAAWLRQTPPLGSLYRSGLVEADLAAARQAVGIASLLGEDDLPAAVKELAEGLKMRMAVDYTLAVGPLYRAIRDGRETMLFDVGLATPQGSEVTSFVYAGHPDLLLSKSTKQALNFLRLKLKI